MLNSTISNLSLAIWSWFKIKYCCIWVAMKYRPLIIELKREFDNKRIRIDFTKNFTEYTLEYCNVQWLEWCHNQKKFYNFIK